jgi:hypothetical protein
VEKKVSLKLMSCPGRGAAGVVKKRGFSEPAEIISIIVWRAINEKGIYLHVEDQISGFTPLEIMPRCFAAGMKTILFY